MSPRRRIGRSDVVDIKKIRKSVDLERQLYEYDGEDKIVTSHQLQGKLKGLLAVENIMSGIPSLDRYLSGFETGEMTVVSGLTKQGKTLFCQTLTKNFAEQDIGCLWFTYELHPLQFFQRFGDSVPLFFIPQRLTNSSLNWIQMRVYEAKLKYDIRVVFIDHLHYLVDLDRSRNISLEIGYVMRTLKTIALERNICLFIVSHTQKLKPETELDISHLRDSAFTAAEADNVLMLWRSVKHEGQSILKIAANRRFGVMGKKIKLQKLGDYLVEVDKGCPT
ncbi:MAG: DnaB-like helicase C-terminal domain-containing protein [Thermodesulfovibrionales bacterium]